MRPHVGRSSAAEKGSQQQPTRCPSRFFSGELSICRGTLDWCCRLPRHQGAVAITGVKRCRGSPASNGESFLCGSCKSVILRANRTGLLTFVAGAAGRALRIVVKTDLVLARIGKGDVRRPPSSASQTSSACRRAGGGSRRQGFK